jgi:hypothetical protein
MGHEGRPAIELGRRKFMTEQEESAGGWNAKRFKYAAIIFGCVGLAGFLNQFAPGPAAEDA